MKSMRGGGPLRWCILHRSFAAAMYAAMHIRLLPPSCWAVLEGALNSCLSRKKSIHKVQHFGSDRPTICLTWLALLWPRTMSRLRMPVALACAGRFSCAIWSGTPVRLVTVKCGSSQIACDEVLWIYSHTAHCLAQT